MPFYEKIMAAVCVVLVVASWHVRSDPLAISKQTLTLMASDQREVSVTVYSPSGGCEKCTLLFFSHGANIPPENYAALINTWIPAGYVVATPLHVDAETHPHRDDYSGTQIVRTRVEDYEVVTDALLRKNVPINGVTFSGELIATGHSFGAMIAQIAIGATMHPSVGLGLSDDALRPLGAVAISPPGALENYISADDWSRMQAPVLVVTGTEDKDPVFMPQWELHKASYEAAPEGSAYLLVFDGINHYFNGAFGRPLEDGFVGNPETEILNQQVLNFLAALKTQQLPSAASWGEVSAPGVLASSR